MWLHRSCVPFISFKDFEEIFWPTFKPLVQELWVRGHQVLFYAEGKWGMHLKTFAELPERSIIYHVDRDDIFEVHKAIGHKFCISGGIPNVLLSFGKPGAVRDYCRKVIDEVARDGGYILDAGAIMQNDTSVENVEAMTEFTREYGVYRTEEPRRCSLLNLNCDMSNEPESEPKVKRKPGVCIPWEEKLKELPEISGNPQLVQRVWEDIDSLGYTYLWHCVVSF